MKNEKFTLQQLDLAERFGYSIYRTLAYTTDPQTAMLSLTIATALCAVSCDAEMDFDAFKNNVEVFMREINEFSNEKES